ncbi:hypothetical protein BKI52_31525 [marine bacterium AO1-C]|nr:hypothetical protein BKI52_31525 [marine bacterium AO1-C]
MGDLSTSNITLQFLSWVFTYTLHSSLLVLLLWVWFKKRPKMSIYLKDVLLKIALVAGIFTAGFQLYGNKGWNITIDNQTIQQPNTQSQRLDIQNLPPATKKILPVTSPQNEQPNTTSFAIRWHEALTLGWLVTVVFLTLRFVWLKHRFVRSLAFVSIPSPALDHLLKALSDKIKLRQEVQLLLVTNTLSPLVLNKRTIVVPVKALEELSLEQQESMLAHELAHLQRRDDLWLKLSQALQVVLFFQPLNRWLFQQMYEVTEQICDAKAVQLTLNNQALAKCLVEVAGWFTSQPRWVVSMAARQKPLTKRVKQLLNNNIMQHSTKPRFLAPLSIAGMIGLVVIVAIFTLPGIQFSWAQAFKKKPKAKSFKAYTFRVNEESNGRYEQAIVIRNPEGKISEFYLDDKKYAGKDLAKFSFIERALELQAARNHSKKIFSEKYSKLELEAVKNKKELAEAYTKALKIKDEEKKKERMIEIKKKGQKYQEELKRKKKQLEKEMLKKMKKK